MNSVLIIDDEEIDFLIHSQVLRQSKYVTKIIYKNSASAALEYLSSLIAAPESLFPSHILVDINMPVMNGFQFIEEYYKIYPKNISTQIFIVSSSLSPKDREKAKELSLSDNFYTKPLTIDIAQQIFKKELMI